MLKIHKKLFGLGIVLVSISFTLVLLKIPQWYCVGMPAIWLIFDFFHAHKGGQSSLLLLANNSKKFFLIYTIYLIGAIALEMVGRYVVHFWYYPSIDTWWEEGLLFITYPFVFFSFREVYEWIFLLSKTKFLSIILSTFIAMLWCEIPNSILAHWIYTMPFMPNVFGNLNLFALMLWPLFILFSVYLYNRTLAFIAKLYP